MFNVLLFIVCYCTRQNAVLYDAFNTFKCDMHCAGNLFK